MDNNEQIFYVKASDNLGVTSLKAYRFEEIPQQGNVPESVQFVTYAELAELKGQYAELKRQIDNLSSDGKTALNGADSEVEHGKSTN
jgi:hypothetical protein